jgi:hypothetical protein
MPFFLLTGCPLQGKTVDIPPSISVSTIGLGIAGCSWKGAGLLAHGVQNGASLAHWHKRQSAQDGCDGYNIQYLRLQLPLVNNC